MIDKGLYKTRKNFRIGSKSGKDTSGRRYDRPSAPAPSTPRSSPFSGNESRQQYSAKQTQTGAVRGGGRRVGPPGSDKYETGFVSGDDGRAARDARSPSISRNCLFSWRMDLPSVVVRKRR